jgi:hypothetical protein
MPEVDWFDVAIAATVTLLLALASRWKMQREWREHRNWLAGKVRVSGVVERFSISEGSFESSQTTYTPVIVYRAHSGHLYSIHGETAATQEPAIGTAVDVAYDPALPSTARVVNEAPWTSYDRATAVGCFIFVAVLIAIFSGLIRHG